MGSMLEKAKEELKLLRKGNNEPDEMQDLIENNILEIVEVFSKQGHSGSSVSYCIPIINALLKQEIITPLIGKDDEWTNVGNGLFQNKRLFNIFKDKNKFNGQAYNIEGKTWFTNGDSCVAIEFPYMPKEPEEVLINK